MSRKPKAKPPIMVVGIDPAMLTSGHAHGDKSDPFAYDFGTVVGIENLGPAVDSIASAASNDAIVYAVIEYPTWRGKGTDAVRAAANCWIRALKKAFPRRLKIRKVTPQTWMAAMIPGYRKKVDGEVPPPSTYYEPLAREIVGGFDALDTIDENAAAAVCLVAYGEGLIARGEFEAPAKPKKGSA